MQQVTSFFTRILYELNFGYETLVSHTVENWKYNHDVWNLIELLCLITHSLFAAAQLVNTHGLSTVCFSNGIKQHKKKNA